MHHVLGDGVEVLQRAVDVARALLHVQGVVQDDLVTDGGYQFCVLLQVVIVLPLTVELVSITSVDFSELLLEVGGQVNGGVEILPDEGVMLDIPLLNIGIPSFYDLKILDEVLLSDISCCQIANAINRDNSCILNRS